MLGNMDSERRLQIPSLDRVRAALGGRLPSIIENTTFTPDGLAESEKGLLVPVYLANGLGFNEAGRYFIDNEIKPRMEVAGALVFDPFQQCAEFIQPDFFDTQQSVWSQMDKWGRFNQTVIGIVDYELLIPRSKILFAIMEGYPTDEGVAAEVAYMASHFGPVIGVRTDFRLAENPATGTNPAVSYFMRKESFGGGYFEGHDAYDKAFELLRELCAKEVQKHNSIA